MSSLSITKLNVKELFSYDSSSGMLFWKVNASSSVRAGNPIKYRDKDGYLIVRYKRKAYKAHRVVWLFEYGRWPEGVIDHVNGVKDDNRLINIRDVSAKVNLQNIMKPRGGNKCVGVSVVKGAYQTSIMRDGISLYLGRHRDWFEAVCSRKSAESKLIKGVQVT